MTQEEPSSILLQAKNLHKRIGQQCVLKGISLELQRGQILGLLGPNGAGKSTTMRILAGIIEPDAGEVCLFGHPFTIDDKRLRKHVGYLADQNPLYGDMYVREYLKFVANLHQLPAPKESVHQAIAMTGLVSEQHKRIGQLSKGFQQRVGIAQAIIHNPDVLILDEPTSGLDPMQLAEIRTLLAELSKTRAIVLSTHIMQEVEMLCDEVAIIHEGEIAFSGRLDSIPQGVDGGSLETFFLRTIRSEELL